MNKKVVRLMGAFSLVMLIYSFSGASPASSQNYDPTNPESVVRAYFQCLTEGNITGLKDLIGGEVLEEKAQAMRSSNYDEFLKNFFRDAKLEFVRVDPIGRDRTSAELRISQGANVSFVYLILSRTGERWIVTEEVDK